MSSSLVLFNDPHFSSLWKIMADLRTEGRKITTRSVHDASWRKNYGARFGDLDHVRFWFRELEDRGYLEQETNSRGSRPAQWGFTLWGKYYLEYQGSELAYRIVGLKDAIANERWEEGLTHVQALIDAQVENPDFLYFRGLCYQNLSRFEEAIADFSITIARGHHTLESYRKRGQCYSHLGQQEEALKDRLSYGVKFYDYSLEWAELCKLRKFILKNCFELRDTRTKISYLIQAIKADSDFAPYYFYCAIYQSYLGDEDGVIENLQKWLECGLSRDFYWIEPFCTASSNTLPITIFREELRDEELAFQYLDKAYAVLISREPKWVQKLLCQRGDINQLFGRWEMALQYYNQAEQYGSPSAWLYGRRGNIHKHLGNSEESSADYNKYLEGMCTHDDQFDIYYQQWLCQEHLRVGEASSPLPALVCHPALPVKRQPMERPSWLASIDWSTYWDVWQSEPPLMGFMLGGISAIVFVLFVLSIQL